MSRRRRTLPPGYPSSTIRAVELNGRVRDGNGCSLYAIVTSKEENRGRERVRACRNGRSSPKRCSTLGEKPEGGGTGQASRAISTAQLHVLPRFHLLPINVLVSYGPSETRRSGSIHLGRGFPLRCFQRLSRPDVATRRCSWRNNRYTSGRSFPVLSY